MNFLKQALIIGLFLSSQFAYAVYPRSEADMMVLPPFCKARLAPDRDKDPGYQEWMKRMGPNFIHIHHYCAGLFTMGLADKSFDKAEKVSHLNAALGELTYVVQHSTKPFKFLPRVIYDIGQAYEKLDNTTEAMKAYQRCIEMNPRLPIPYAALSDLFKKNNNKSDAIAILEQGLKYKPKSKSLLSRMEKLGQGKKS